MNRSRSIRSIPGNSVTSLQIPDCGNGHATLSTSPDRTLPNGPNWQFRTQVLRAKLDRLDAVLFTHSNADHIMGLDDVRPFNFRQRTSIPIFASADAMSTIQRCFETARALKSAT